jgi:hypothetical protein
MKKRKRILTFSAVLLLCCGCSSPTGGSSTADSTQIPTESIGENTIADSTQVSDEIMETAADAEASEAEMQVDRIFEEDCARCEIGEEKALAWTIQEKDCEMDESMQPDVLPTKGLLWSALPLSGSWLLEISQSAEGKTTQGRGELELAVYDPETDAYTVLSETASQAFGYERSEFTAADRYYVRIRSYPDSETADDICGMVDFYDTETGTYTVADSYEVHNIVQYGAAAAENGLVWCYYEAGTQDWVVKYYSFAEGTAEEIFRHTNENENTTASPMALAVDGEQVALAVQYRDEDAYTTYTRLLWFTLDGDYLKTEELPLYDVFGHGACDIETFDIFGSYYCFSTKKGTLLLERDGDTFYPLSVEGCEIDQPCSISYGRGIGYSLSAKSGTEALYLDFSKETGTLYRVAEAENSVSVYFDYDGSPWLMQNLTDDTEEIRLGFQRG